MTNMSRALVTGAGGFIGSHLAELLVERGWLVRALVRYSSSGHIGMLADVPKRTRSAMEIVYGDVRDADSMERAAVGVGVVFHLAALIAIAYSYHAPESYLQTNVMGTLNVLRAADRAKATRVVQTSTSETYGSAQYVPIDEKHPASAQSPYAASKVASDQLALSYHRSFGTPVVVLRPFNTYGPRQSARAVVPTIMSQMLFSDRVRLGALTPIRDLVYVRDTCEAFLAAATSDGVVGDVYNCASGVGVTVADLVDRARRASGRHVPTEQQPERFRPVASEVDRLVGSSEKLYAATGWSPAVDLETGLASVAAWVERHPEYFSPGTYAI